MPTNLAEVTLHSVKKSTSETVEVGSRFYRLSSIEQFTDTYASSGCGFNISPVSGFSMTFTSTAVGSYTDISISLGKTDPAAVTSLGTVAITEQVTGIDVSIHDDAFCGDAKT